MRISGMFRGSPCRTRSGEWLIGRKAGSGFLSGTGPYTVLHTVHEYPERAGIVHEGKQSLICYPVIFVGEQVAIRGHADHLF